ncbi:MAG: phosphoheptose isomerase [Planctomycetota bacterium]|nr:MAG: phosphoheptose isomerase [Planctomycetota bacterium]
MEEIIRKSFEQSIAVKRETAERHAAVIADMARVMTEALRGERRIYIAGNGGSAADAQHIAGELVGRFAMERKALPVVALTTDTSVLTAVANDYGFDEVFRRQVEAHVREGDVLLCISTSGDSPNVLRALEEAKKRSARVLALAGRDGGALARAAELCVTVPAQETWRIQETHITIGHILCELIESELFKDAK